MEAAEIMLIPFCPCHLISIVKMSKGLNSQTQLIDFEIILIIFFFSLEASDSISNLQNLFIVILISRCPSSASTSSRLISMNSDLSPLRFHVQTG